MQRKQLQKGVKECGSRKSKSGGKWIFCSKCELQYRRHKLQPDRKPELQLYIIFNATKQPFGKKKKKFGKFLTGFVIIATLAGELGGTIIHEVQNYFEDYTYDDSDSYTEDDPYSDVQEVMPEEGELYEADLTAGIYKGGVHLPQGTYTLTCKSGSGQVELTDSKNNIWVQYNFGDDYDNTEEEVSDFEVFPDVM